MSTREHGSTKFDAYCRKQKDGVSRFCAEVASRCGVSVVTVYRWRSGEHGPSITNAATLESITHGEVRAVDWADEDKRKRDAAA